MSSSGTMQPPVDRRVPLRLLTAFLTLANLAACTTQSVKFASDPEASVSLVDWKSPDAPGDSLGKTPVTIDLAKVGKRLVKITAPGKIPQYWVFNDLQGASVVEAKIELLDAPVAAPKTSSNSDPNTAYRLLMAAYQALSGRDLALAKDLAAKLAQVNPEIAAPLILDGLVAIEEGRKADAHAAFVKAKTLDPADANIDALLKAVE